MNLPPTWLAAMLGLVLAAGWSPCPSQTVDLRLNRLEVGVDEKTGSIVRLSHPEVGLILNAQAQLAGLLDAAYPLDAFGPMRLASRFSRASVAREANGAAIVWERLGPSRPGVSLPGGPVSARVTLRAAEDGISVVLSCRIENRSTAAVPQVLFPDLHGLQPLEGAEHTRLRFARGAVEPFAGPVKPEHGAPFYVERGWKHYPASSYYGLNALRWLDFGGLRGGISFFQKRWGSGGEPAVRTSRTEADPTALRLLWEHRAEIAPGAAWDSGEFWLTPHRGGWAKGIEVYRRWVQEVNPPRQLPRHIRDSIGFMTIWMVQELEIDPQRAAFRFRDLPRVAADARAHSLHEIVPWGWCRYFRLPIPLRTELGSQADFIAALREAKAQGVNIAPFTSVHNALPEASERYGVKPGSGNWTYHPELIPNFRPFYNHALSGGWIDAGNAAWQRDVLEELSRWIGRGLTSFSWDQFSNRTDANTPSHMVQLIGKVRAAARAVDPESTFSGESIRPGSMEEDGAVLDYTWNWTDYLDAGPLLNVLRAPRLNCNVEDSPLVVKKGFADGLFLNVMPRRPDQPNGTALIGEHPALSETLKQVAALRRQFLPYFVEGHFLGDSILTAPAPGFVRAHQRAGGLLVIVLNDGPTATPLSFPVDLDPWLPSTASYEIRRYDGRGSHGASWKSSGAHVQLSTPVMQPLDLALFEIAAGR